MRKLILLLFVLCALPAFATWSHVAGCAVETSSTNTHSCTITGTINAGDILVVGAGCGNNVADPTSVTTSLGSTTLVEVRGSDGNNTSGHVNTYTAKVGAGGTNPTVTVTYASSCNFHEVGAEVMRSTTTTNASFSPVGGGTNAGTNTSVTITLNTGTSDNAFYILWTTSNGSNLTATNGTLGAKASSTANGFIYKLNLTGSQTLAGTATGSNNWVADAVAWGEAAASTTCNNPMLLMGAGCE